MKIEFFEGFAFTNTPESPLGQRPAGNPALVCFSPLLFEEKVREQISCGAKSPMTVFVSPAPKGKAYDVRYHGPKGLEVDFCGHASFVAHSFFTIFRKGHAACTYNLNPNFLASNSRLYTQSQEFGISIKHTLYRSRELDDPEKKGKLVGALNISEKDITRVVVSKVGDIIVVLNQSASLRRAKPHFETLIELGHGVLPHRTLVLTAISCEEGFDYEARVFIPCIGVNEDIACGSVNCSLAPFWQAITGKEELKMFYVSPLADGCLRVGGVQALSLGKGLVTITSNVRASWYECLEIDDTAELVRHKGLDAILRKVTKSTMVEGAKACFGGLLKAA